VLLWRTGGCGEAPGGLPELEPRQVASALVRALGLPQSGELPPPPAGCALPPPATLLPTFGTRQGPPRAGGEAGEYLESLRSLGYL
jgi:hypothetical protein